MGYQPKRKAQKAKKDPQKKTKKAVSPQKKTVKKGKVVKKEILWLSLLFFPVALLYHEMLLPIFDPKSSLGGILLLYLVLFSAATGMAVYLLVNLLPAKAGRVSAIVLSSFWVVFLGVQYCCKSFFTTYFPLAFMVQMTQNVVGDFGGDAVDVAVHRIPFILLDLVPLVLLIGFRKHIIPEEKTPRLRLLITAAVFVVCQASGSLLGYLGADKAYYTYNFTADDAVPKFGLVTELRLETEYGIFGLPSPPSLYLEDDTSEDTTFPTEVVYGYNKLDLDFTDLTGSSILDDMGNYFSSLTPTRQNVHTGQFKGKNLILITAEGFSGYAVSPQLTPTLYRLSREGFYFTNYYQPAWGQSTTGGEYSILTGLIPTWQRGGTTTAFYAGRSNAYPFTMGNQLRALGYTTLAYHDNTYDYYNRHLTHPGMGYDYYGVGNGLVLRSGQGDNWPASDQEMMEVTADDYINDYVQNGQPFHVYYMTVSGHAYYGWGHPIALKYKDAAQAAYPNASTVSQAYIATQLELEAALKTLVDKLEAAGIADDTVICLSADHYPYAMTTEGSDPYYSELSGITDTDAYTTRYKNALIIWCGDMESEQVDIPCTAVDILPTLSNLFGLSYDSRLLSGRDVFADNYDGDKLSTAMPLAVVPTTIGKGWVTPAGTYEPRTGTFTLNPGHTVSDDYVETVNAIVDAKYSYAARIVETDYYRLLGY